mgnify:CR=1 FL=1
MTNLPFNMSGLQKQPYISWKGESNSESNSESNLEDRNYTTSSAVPTNSNPVLIKPNLNQKYTGKANPLKHWRKQLIPSQGAKNTSRKVSVSQVMDRPGGSNHLVSNLSDCENCSHNMKNYISKDSQSTFDRLFETSDNCWTDTENKKKVTILNPARITRPASTIVSKKYYTTSKAYLKSRVKLYDQNQTLSNITPPNAQNFNSTNCCADNNNAVQVIYKPNNPGFSKEGAVTSSNRIVKLKYDTIQKAASNLKENWGQNGANAAKYRGNAEAPYYMKSKMELPVNQCKTNKSIDGRQPSGGSGIHTICFPTLSSDIKHKNGSILSNVIGTGTGNLITKQLTNNQISELCKHNSKNAELINRLKLKSVCELGKNITKWNTLKTDCCNKV